MNDWNPVEGPQTAIGSSLPARMSGRRVSDYQGRTNWDTWNTGLMIDNERETNEQAREIVKAGMEQGLDDNALAAKLRDWAIPAIIGPHNQQAIDSAKEWNSIPEEERLDYDYEAFKDKHGDNPDAMDLIHGLAGGPDVSDTDPTLIDPELVNWHEIVQSIKNEFEEDAEFERRQQQAQESGLDWASNGGDNYDKMRDAIYRHHGALPDSELEKSGISRFKHPNAYFNTNVTLTPQEFLQTNPNWDNYIEPKSRIPIWDIMRKRYPNLPNSDRDALTDWNDPEIRAHLEQDPNYQNIMKNGHKQSLHDYADDVMYAITHGTQHPHIPVMQQALAQRGYTPEQIAEIMKQRWRFNPSTKEWEDMERNMDVAPAPDKTLDQPGDLTIPNEWISKTAAPEDWSPIEIEELEEPYEFGMPPSVEQRFVQAHECPLCQGRLLKSPGGIYCSHCGWEPRAQTKVAFDWSNLTGDVNAKRRPWWVDMSNPNDPNPTMWIGDAGSTHPYPLPVTPDARRSTILGALDESTTPPTFFHYVSQNHPNLPLADKALSHVQRAYFQMKDDPSKRTADFDPTRGSIVYHKGDDRMVNAPFDKRRIYLYDPDRDILHWGNPGQWHGDIRRDIENWYTQNGLQPPHYGDLIAGGIGQTDRGDKLHGVYSPDPMGFEGTSGDERYDHIYNRLHELTGVPVTPNMTPDSMLDMLYPPDAGMGYGSSDWKISSDGADYLTQSGDDWWGPQSVNLQHIDVPGEAPGMGDPAQLPQNTLLKNPCYCDVGSTMPHEWTGSCENGKRPIMEREATVIPDGWVKEDLDLEDDGSSWDDGGQWDTDTFLDHNIINQHLKTQQQAQEYLDYLDRQNRKPEWPDIGVREASDNWDEMFAKPDYGFSRSRGGEAYRKFLFHPDLENQFFDWVPEEGEWSYSDFLPSHGDMAKTQGVDWHYTPGIVTVRPDHVSIGIHRLQTGHSLDEVKNAAANYYRRIYPGRSIVWHGVRNSPNDRAERLAADNVPGNSMQDSGHWVWLDGHVGFGTDHGNIAKDLANTRGYDPTKVNYISNMVSRNLMPEGHAIAVGTLKKGYPHIWMSTRDRNAVWDDVMRAREEQPMVKAAALFHPRFEPGEWLTDRRDGNRYLVVEQRDGEPPYEGGYYMRHENDEARGAKHVTFFSEPLAQEVFAGHPRVTTPSEEEANTFWPDTLPWSDEEQQYYRTSGLKDDAHRAYDSLVANGGFSLTRSLKAAQGQAYFVSYEQPNETIPISEFSPETIMSFRQQVLPMLKADTETLLGGWLDAGMVYLDVSRAFQDRDAAIAFGQANNQLAIWDGFNNVEIRLDEGYQEVREARIRKLGHAVEFTAPIYSPTLADENTKTSDAHMGEQWPEEPDSLMQYAEEVPVNLLLPAREWMRGPGEANFDRSNTWNALVSDITSRGFMSPIWLEWSSKTGMAYVGEGNTRIAVALEAGLPTVPVAVYRKTEVFSRGGEIGPFRFDKEQWLKDEGITPDMPAWQYKIDDGYVPQYFKPHYLIGFLTQHTASAPDAMAVASVIRQSLRQGADYIHIAQGTQQWIMQHYPQLAPQAQDQLLRQAWKMALGDVDTEPSIERHQHMIYDQPPSHLMPQYNDPKWSRSR